MAVQSLVTGQWYNFANFILVYYNTVSEYFQLDALSPAVDTLMRDLPGVTSHEQYIEILRTAVEVSQARNIMITSRMYSDYIALCSNIIVNTHRLPRLGLKPPSR